MQKGMRTAEEKAKSEKILTKLLTRKIGATKDELERASDLCWRSIERYMKGLVKTLKLKRVSERRSDGLFVYRLVEKSAVAPKATKAPAKKSTKVAKAPAKKSTKVAKAPAKKSTKGAKAPAKKTAKKGARKPAAKKAAPAPEAPAPEPTPAPEAATEAA